MSTCDEVGSVNLIVGLVDFSKGSEKHKSKAKAKLRKSFGQVHEKKNWQ